VIRLPFVGGFVACLRDLLELAWFTAICAERERYGLRRDGKLKW